MAGHDGNLNINSLNLHIICRNVCMSESGLFIYSCHSVFVERFASSVHPVPGLGRVGGKNSSPIIINRSIENVCRYISGAVEISGKIHMIFQKQCSERVKSLFWLLVLIVE